MSDTEFQEIREFAESICTQAGRKAMAARTGDLKVRFKAGKEPVTQVDIDIEQWVRAAILERFPSHQVIGEEEGASGNVDADYSWYVDPIDGTRNFSRGIPYFNVSIGVMHKEEPVVGAVHDAILDECYSAHLNGGATCAGQPIGVSKNVALADSLVIFDYHKSGLPKYAPELLGHVFERIGKLRIFGAVALDLCYVARGRVDAIVALGSFKYKRMDLVAGFCILKEAGAVIKDFQGHDFRWDSAELIGGHPLLVEAIRHVGHCDPL